jgi:gas vesicle protein
MNEGGKITRRRDVLRATAGAAVAAASAVLLAPAAAAAETETVREKRKARYQANSAEVQDFYRVNRYPAH